MKIPPITRIGALRAYERMSAVNRTEGVVPSRPDQVEISSDASSFYGAFKATMQSIEGAADEKKLQAVKAQVEEGSYRVSSRELAEKILSGSRLDIKG